MKLDQFKDIIKDAKVFCEVGVYKYSEGYCRLEQQVNEGKEVILVEASPICVEDIEKCIKGKENVTLHPVAVGDEYGDTILVHEGASAFTKEIEDKCPCVVRNYWRPGMPEYKVRKVRFSSLDNGRIDALVVDVEGMEYFVLKHLRSRPELIILETHYEEYTNPYLKEIQTWCQQNGYEEIAKDESDTAYLRRDSR